MAEITLLIDPDAAKRLQGNGWRYCPNCGNREETDGFSYCTADGEEVEPTLEDWDQRHYGCNRCGLLLEIIYTSN